MGVWPEITDAIVEEASATYSAWTGLDDQTAMRRALEATWASRQPKETTMAESAYEIVLRFEDVDRVEAEEILGDVCRLIEGDGLPVVEPVVLRLIGGSDAE